MPPADRVFHGVDFSGSRKHRRKTWVATFDGEQPASTRRGFSHRELVDAIAACAGDGRRHFWLLDAPLSLAVEDLERHGVEPTWDASLAWLASFDSPQSWRRAARAVSRREARRGVDRRFRTPHAPLNIRLFKQTWHSIVSVVRPLRALEEVAVLPMELAARPGGRERREEASVQVGEGCPASTLRHLGWLHRGYKGGAPANRERRAAILDLLGREEDIAVEGPAAASALDDPDGDALDSLVLLSACRRFAAADHRAILRDDALAAVEGWVYV